MSKHTALHRWVWDCTVVNQSECKWWPLCVVKCANNVHTSVRTGPWNHWKKLAGLTKDTFFCITWWTCATFTKGYVGTWTHWKVTTSWWMECLDNVLLGNTGSDYSCGRTCTPFMTMMFLGELTSLTGYRVGLVIQRLQIWVGRDFRCWKWITKALFHL